MRAVIMSRVGDVSVLEEREVDYPRLEAGDVLIKVRGCGLCYRDTLARRGYMRAKIPVIPGHEVSGEIVEVGDNVLGLSRGDLVSSLIYVYDPRSSECREDSENICRGNMWIGEDLDGCYAEYIKLPYWILDKIGDPGETRPEAYSFAACVIGTIIRALKTLGEAKRGEYVLVTGASGGVGIHAVQVAKSLGLKVIAVTRSEEKAKLIKGYGVDEVIVYRDKFSEDVRKYTDGRGPDIVVETVGGPTLDQSLRAVSRGGRVLVIGNVDPKPQQVMLGLIILKEIRVLGVLNSTHRELREAIRLLREGLIKPVYKTIPLDVNYIREAHQILESGGAFGRFIITP
ncbi:MAG: zinc-binding dehydrogenase [Acidilobaceae archaeon]